MNRMFGWFPCLAVVFSIGGGICMNVPRQASRMFTRSLPKAIKAGATLRDLLDTVIHYHNLNTG